MPATCDPCLAAHPSGRAARCSIAAALARALEFGECLMSGRPSATFSRRALIGGLALLPALSGTSSRPWPERRRQPIRCHRGATGLRSRRSSTSRARPRTGRARTTFRPEERIAVFDQDGTLWVEHPMYSQVVYCLDRVPAVVAKGRSSRTWSPSRPCFPAIARRWRSCRCGTSKILVATLTGMPVEEFNAEANKWLETARDSRWKRPYTELVYQPMLEVLALSAHQRLQDRAS